MIDRKRIRKTIKMLEANEEKIFDLLNERKALLQNLTDEEYDILEKEFYEDGKEHFDLI